MAGAPRARRGLSDPLPGVDQCRRGRSSRSAGASRGLGRCGAGPLLRPPTRPRLQRRAALVVSIVAVVVLMFGQWASAMQPLGLSGLPLFAGWVLIGAALIALVSFARSDLRGVTNALNIGSAILVAFTLVGIGGHLLSEPATFVGGQRLDGQASPPPNPGAAPEPSHVTSTTSSSTPTARPGPWTSTWTCRRGLRGLAGGRRIRRAPRNPVELCRTPLSLASSMNMTYLDELAAERGPDDPSHLPLEQTVAERGGNPLPERPRLLVRPPRLAVLPHA